MKKSTIIIITLITTIVIATAITFFILNQNNNNTNENNQQTTNTINKNTNENTNENTTNNQTQNTTNNNNTNNTTNENTTTNETTKIGLNEEEIIQKTSNIINILNGSSEILLSENIDKNLIENYNHKSNLVYNLYSGASYVNQSGQTIEKIETPTKISSNNGITKHTIKVSFKDTKNTHLFTTTYRLTTTNNGIVSMEFVESK